ncbi:MAG: FHA domain-containing protein [Gemmatimonadetes bacterium]|nr:FHA domain-containing protein [Gemmatimonadota bacterium]
MKYTLVGTEGNLSFDLRDNAPMIVGRALTSDIPIPDPTISRRHAEVSIVDGKVHVRDLGSSNGTFRNGEQITASVCGNGDLVVFGKVSFKLEIIAPAGVRSPTPAGPPPLPDHGMGASPTAAVASQGPTKMAGATIVRALPADFKEVLAASLRSKEQKALKHDDVTAERQGSSVQERLTTLLDVSTELTKAVSLDALLEKIVDKCWGIFPIDRVAILLGDESNVLVPKIAKDRKGNTLGTMVPQSIARSVFGERQAIVSEDAGEDSRFAGQSIVLQQVRSAMCAPMVGSEGRALGVIYADCLFTRHRFTEDDLNFLIAFAGIAAVAVENSQFSERIRREALTRSNFERFFTPGLAARIAASPDALKLGGEKRMVAVLFSDIRGFTAMSEKMEADEMAKLLSEYFTEMVECVFKFGGTLDKFIGDAVMAQWGAPLSEEDDPDRAMGAAVEMMRDLERLNMRWAAEGRPQLQIGIGLNYGEAFAGNIGSERRLEYTVIGDTVNTASRLCGAAAGGEILLSEAMRNAMKKSPRLKSHPPMELKGKSHPLPVFSVEL